MVSVMAKKMPKFSSELARNSNLDLRLDLINFMSKRQLSQLFNDIYVY